MSGGPFEIVGDTDVPTCDDESCVIPGAPSAEGEPERSAEPGERPSEGPEQPAAHRGAQRE